MKETVKKILRAMDVESQEASIVVLLLVQSVFLGIFYGAFDTAANSLFLGIFPAGMLPKAFTISGVVGIIMTTLYSRFQSKIPFSLLAILNLTVVALLTILMWAGFSLTSSKWHVFLVLVMMGPLNIIAMLGFWGTAGRLFSLRQGKRLFGLVDAGQIIGIILSSYAVPILLNLNVKTKDILLISSVSTLIALSFQIILTLKNKKLGVKVEISKKTDVNSRMHILLKNKFVRLMAIFVALSMITAFFISFSFLAATKIKYPSVTEFAKFFGVFVGTVMFVTLMIKTFVYGKFMKSYGLRTSLIISPVLLIILTIIAALLGSLGGYTAAASGFIFYFLLIALSRLFSVSLKNSIEVPSFKILYQTIDVNIRHHVQARVDGTINEISALFSGVLLLGLGSLSFFKLINFTQVLIVILILWVWTAYKLYKAYKNNLDESLVNLKSSGIESESVNITGITSKFLHGNENAAKVVFVMNLQEIIQPIIYERLVPILLNHRLTEVKKYALYNTDKLHLYEALDALEKIEDNEIEKQSRQIAERMSAEISAGIMNERILFLTRSKQPSDRKLAARLIGQSKNDDFINYLKFLLRDYDDQVKIAAIKAASNLKNPELGQLLAEFLILDKFCRYSFDSLVEIGQSVIENLENLFNKSSHDIILLSRIVRIIGNIGGEKACLNLIHKVNYHNIEIARLSAKMLLNLNYQVDEEHFYLVHQSLAQVMSITAWNIAARASLREAHADDLIQQALKNEIHSNFDHIFTLLSLAYDAKSISHIRQNVESENSESTDYAIELLELVVADELKPMLFPIIDDSSDIEKIRLLQHYFPIDIIPLTSLLIDIINRDFNYIGKWVKACALKSLVSLEVFEITDDLIAQLFNPDELLSELAAFVIFKNNPEKFNNCALRLGEKTRIRLLSSINYFNNEPEKLLISKILFLNKINYFSTVPGDKLFYLASIFEEQRFVDGEDISGIDEELSEMIYIIIEGRVLINYEGFELNELGSGSLFGGLFSQKYPKIIPTFTSSGNVHLFAIKHELFETMIFDYPEFANNIVMFNPIESE